MTESLYAGWLEQYRKAWIDRNATAAGALFTEDAVYRDHAFQPPHVGRAAIERYWSTVTASQTEVELRYGVPIVVGRRLAVEWWANLVANGAPITLAGEFLLTFADSAPLQGGGGQCRELREYWVLTQARVEPPAGWGQ
jgi:hypothetical protein